MSIASLFKDFRLALTVSNAADISQKYGSITTRLNADFWDIESDQRNSLQIGSYGRHTAIEGVSDLDMVFELPAAELERYKKLEGNGPSSMLREVRDSLKNRYPNTTIKADGQVVGVFFNGYHVEVLPAFLNADGDYIHGDTNNGGSWKVTKPRPEIKVVNELDKVTNGNLKDVSKMLRAWKNKDGVGIGGLLIDTFSYNFFSQSSKFNAATYSTYPDLFLDLFTYLARCRNRNTGWHQEVVSVSGASRSSKQKRRRRLNDARRPSMPWAMQRKRSYGGTFSVGISRKSL
ncbi:hypothetical protein [Rhodanobacter sp. 115]|uniref:SMODS domain-containing nucleotidyltransferase n=1 Tax=Rhodanobacter sp. FW021-MT20 TaxID=1162282 RepID=UPI0003078F58|nr:hypothetical protein [Rhodanobacter sp. 115]